MIEGKGQQILDKIQLSPTKTISTNTMRDNIFFFTNAQVRPFQFHTPLRVQANGQWAYYWTIRYIREFGNYNENVLINNSILFKLLRYLHHFHGP